MKKKIVAMTALALTAVLALSACGSSKMTMGTGGTTGTYYGFGQVLATEIKADADIDVTVVSTGGSAANIQGIDDGDYQLATVQSDVMAYAYNGEKLFEEPIETFNTLGGLYAESVQLITVDPAIQTVADLEGKSVSIGDNGSGVYFNAVDVLAGAGLTVDDIDPQYQSFGDSAEALKDGKIDAAFVVAGAPTPAITELAATAKNGVYFINIDGEVLDNILADCPYYTEYTIPADAYGLDADVTTITVKATMIVSADADEDDVYEITKSIYESAGSLSHDKAAELTLENATSGMAVPFHPGAAKYYAEQGITVE